MQEVYLSVGSNIEPLKNIEKVKKKLRESFNCRFSKVYEYQAVGFDGPDFLNFVVNFFTDFQVEEVEKVISRIEEEMGRQEEQRGFSNRIIDIDLLLFGDLISENTKNIPHRNLKDCIFVLEPLVELSPNAVHPINKKTFKEILNNLGGK